LMSLSFISFHDGSVEYPEKGVSEIETAVVTAMNPEINVFIEFNIHTFFLLIL